MINTILHKADSRGGADYGWLKTRYSFSFAEYYDPKRMGFGALRVINDDYIAPDTGFGTHPHNNMEIITIPLSGVIWHKDSMGNEATISAGEIQCMSAGSGIYHSEYNKSLDEPLTLFQIWVMPNKANVEPKYSQIKLADYGKRNQLNQIISPNPEDAGAWIHQDAWFHLGDFDENIEINYKFKLDRNGLYIFVVEGEINVLEQDLMRRDGFGISGMNEIKISVKSKSTILLMEVPV